jgi:predicted nuclease of restriction endonuclease-like (RecB) superfamily
MIKTGNKKGISAKSAKNAPSSDFNFAALVDLCRRTHDELQHRALRSADIAMVVRNWLLGWYIVEYEQNGADRAKYGSKLIERLAAKLLIKGTSATNLRKFCQLYREYPIQQTLSVELEKTSAVSLIWRTVSVELIQRFTLSWSHYVTLLSISDQKERQFYEIEAKEGGWSNRDLDRQIASSLYERLALSRNKKEIRRLSQKGQTVEKAADIIKNPLVLEFLGLEEKSGYSENDLEIAIIDKIERFLLELGKGFLFEARQKRFTFDNDHFYVDLVFYNRLLRCYVLVDLKRDKLTHQDLGQMQMYVNYFDRYVKTEDELPTIGIVLCHRKNNALVELTLPKDANIFASKYQLYLPSREVLKAQLEKIEAEFRESASEIINISAIEREQLKKLKKSPKKLMLDE